MNMLTVCHICLLRVWKWGQLAVVCHGHGLPQVSTHLDFGVGIMWLSRGMLVTEQMLKERL